jgi:GNAT superfamily N-acetyltransferase
MMGTSIKMEASFMVEVKKVSGKRMMRDFIRFPWSAGIYDNDPAWIPPLVHDQETILNPQKSYFFEIGEAQLYLAYRGNVPVGRISAHVNHLYEEKYDSNTGFFGFFESINDTEAASALFDAASAWLKTKGKSIMNGPQSFSVYDSVGFEVKGADKMPSVGLFHFAPYYPDLAEACGFTKCIDWHCFLVTKDDYASYEPYLRDVRHRFMENTDVVFKTLDKRDMKRRIKEIQHIFNVAWEGNWGHLPLTERQTEMLSSELKLIAIPELAIFAEKDGKTIGFIISLPDVNPALRVLNGRLYPWRLLKFMAAAKKTRKIRTIIMGVLPEYRGQHIDDIFYLKTIEDGIRLGYTESDCSLIVETNKKMIGALKPLVSDPYKTYRIYQRLIV